MTEARKKEIQELGYKAFMAVFEEAACPLKDDAERALWLQGFNEAKTLWNRPFVERKKTFTSLRAKPQTRYTRNGGKR